MLHPRHMGRRVVAALVFCLVLTGLFAAPSAAEELFVANPLVEHLASRVYASSKKDSQCIGVLEDGTPLTVLWQIGSRYRIDCYGQICYIPSEQVAQDPSSMEYYVNCDTTSGDTVTLETRELLELEEIREELLELAVAQDGNPYVFGGESPGGFDCSGLIQYVYYTMGFDVARTAFPQLEQSVIVNPESMEPGDLVFFCGTDDSDDFITHVGLYLGDDMFIHAGTKGGVCIRSLEIDYFAERFRCARRLLIPSAAPVDSRHCWLELN